MKTFAFFWREWSLVYYTAALRYLCDTRPSHPDIPHIVLQISKLESKRIRCAQV